MKEPLISIIVPIYNTDKYLEECLNSIINQTYKKIEIILIDDGSPDNCPKICDEYAKKDKRIKVIHKENGGLSSARNAGLDIMTGDYVAFIDSDDMVSSFYIKKLLDTCIKNEVDISQCDFLDFKDVEEKMLPTEINREFKTKIYTNIESIDLLYQKDGYRNVVVWNKLYKAKIYKDLRFPVGKINEDEYCTYKALDMANKVAVIGEALYFYRQNENSIMGRKFNIKRLAIIEAHEERINYFSQKGYTDLYVKSIKRYHDILKNCYVRTKENIHQSSEKKEAFETIKQALKNNYNRIKKDNHFGTKQKILKFIIAYFPIFYFFIINVMGTFKKKRKFKKVKANYLKYKLKCKNSGQKEYVLFNTPIHGNLGDQAILLSEIAFLKDCSIDFFEIPNIAGKNSFVPYEGLINEDAIILVHGGGYIGTIWDNENDNFNYIITTYKNNKIIVLPQTVFYEDSSKGEFFSSVTSELLNECKDITIFVREEFSYKYCIEHNIGKKVILCPDIVLYNGFFELESQKVSRDNVSLFAFRTDKEKTGSYENLCKMALKKCDLNYNIIQTDTVINRSLISYEEKKESIEDKLLQYKKSKICFTDRLHGMVFAYLTRTPCIVFSNNNYKIKGVYNWIKDCGYIKFIDDRESISTIIKDLLKYDNNTKKIDFTKDFKYLREILTEKRKDNN